MSAYFRPSASLADIQAMALAAFGVSGAVIPAWYDKDAWLFNGSTGPLTQTTISGVASSGSPVIGVSGFVAATTDGASGLYLCQHVGSLIHYASGGALTAYTLASGSAFVGATYLSSENAPYALQESGSLYTLSGSSLVPVAPNPAFSVPSYSLHGSGTQLFTMLPTISGIGTFSLSSQASGTSGLISVPMSVLMCMTVSSSGSFPIVVGGWNQNSFASGFTSLSLATDPANNTIVLGAASGTGLLSLWTQASGTFSFNQSLSGLSNPSYVNWANGGTTAFVCDPVSGHVYDISYLLNTLSIAQTIALSGATQSAFTPAGDYALVTQPTQNQITIYHSSGTWSASGTLAVTGATSILSISASGMAIGGTSGIFYANLVGSTWSLESSGALPFKATNLAVDTAGNIYATGISGGSGFVAVVSGTSLLASGSWAGSGDSVVWQQGQIVVADIVSSLIRIFQPIYSLVSSQLSLSQINSYAIASGLTTLDFSTPYLLASASGITWLYQFDAPYSLAREQSGVVSIYNGSTWTTVSLGALHTPESIGFDTSGNISVATLQNDFYTISASGHSVISQSTITQDINQPQSTPIGVSRLLWLNGHLYGARSLNDSLVQIA